ncbi:MAG: (d)CMP kinase [Corynebacterium sp.]|nr:(d)CMP kinase [Corynebacterium sp.]
MPDGGLLLAVDGPSGTGKSTTCRNLAKILDAKYVDTGAMYRVATLAVLRAGVDPTDKAGVIAVTEDLPLGISSDPDSTEVFLGNEDISRAIREDEVTRNVSAVSAIPEVRDNLVRLQRKIALESGRAIVEGRDIGTVVLADSPAKAYMTASAEVRAQRRFDQNQAAGMNADFDVILADIQRRDDADSSRETSPLRPAKDAVIVDTSNLSREEVIEALLNIVKESAND